jgi:hypothetical protein
LQHFPFPVFSILNFLTYFEGAQELSAAKALFIAFGYHVKKAVLIEQALILVFSSFLMNLLALLTSYSTI